MVAPSYVTYELRDNGVALVTLDNPPLNLNTLVTLDRLNETCAEIAANESVRAVVITGSGERAFCAGSDISEFADVRHEVVPRKLARENAAFTAIEELPMPVIAALNGVTLGGGGEIALACDIRFMDEAARIGFPEVKLGVFPGSGGVFRLPKLIGIGRAYELLYSGEIIGAAEAHRIGLVNRVIPAGQVVSAAIAFAETLSARPALSLSLMRKAVRDSFNQTTEQATAQTLADSHKVFTGPDIEEGIAAFFGKRPPKFTASRNQKPNKK